MVDQKNYSETVRELAPHSGEFTFWILHRHLFIFLILELAPNLRYLAPQNRELAPQSVDVRRRFLKKRRIKFFEKR